MPAKGSSRKQAFLKRAALGLLGELFPPQGVYEAAFNTGVSESRKFIG